MPFDPIEELRQTNIDQHKEMQMRMNEIERIARANNERLIKMETSMSTGWKIIASIGAIAVALWQAFTHLKEFFR